VVTKGERGAEVSERGLWGGFGGDDDDLGFQLFVD